MEQKPSNKPLSGKEREDFILANIGLVKRIAGDFRDRGLMYDDLVQEGCVGLCRAVDKYDPARGRFSTMARWWIRASITEALNRESLFTTPARVLNARRKKTRESA